METNLPRGLLALEELQTNVADLVALNGVDLAADLKNATSCATIADFRANLENALLNAMAIRSDIEWLLSRTPANPMFAAVGTDGLRPVVWGIGATEAAALADAREWLNREAADPAEALTVHPITAAQAAIVAAGNVSWPITVR